MKTVSIFALVAGLTVAMPLCAQTVRAKDLTPTSITATIKAKPAGERQAYTAMVISAIASMPISEEEKINKLVSAARALIAGSKSGNTIAVIAEIYNSTPIQYLPAVSKMLAGNFDQKLNRLDDAKMALYIEKIVGRAAAYIEVSGCDSPALRSGILTATFVEAATDKAAAMKKIETVLPESLRAAAMAYAEDSMKGNVDNIARAAGVDSEDIAPTPAKDPNADQVVKNPAAAATKDDAAKKDTDAAEIEKAIVAGEKELPKVEATDAVATPDADAAEIEKAIVAGEKDLPKVEEKDEISDENVANVPLLSRFSKDVTGILSDTMDATLYDWEEIDLTTLPTDPLSASLLGLGNVTNLPGEAIEGGFAIDMPESPLYDGQR
jgi:hypothetical protein